MTEHPKAADVVTVPVTPDAGLMSVIAAMVRRIAVPVSLVPEEVYFDNGHARQIYKAITDAASPVQPSHAGEGDRERLAKTIYDATPIRVIHPEPITVMTWAEVLADPTLSVRAERVYREADAVFALRTNPEGVGVDGRVQVRRKSHHFSRDVRWPIWRRS